MHKSRLAGFIIDCQTGDLDGAATFWSQALGVPLKPLPDPADAGYRHLEPPPDQPHLEVQQVEHPSRVHIDIETDDIDAEVLRLEQLGARRIRQVKQWWVMEAPTGHRFCIVRPSRPDFSENANTWSG